jgi:hypothetical protein
MTTTTDHSETSLRYLDSDGSGVPDGFVSVRVAPVGWPDDDGRIVQRVVVTRADGIGDDGVPSCVRVRERVTESYDDGTERELTIHAADFGPGDPAGALAVIASTGQDAHTHVG